MLRAREKISNSDFPSGSKPKCATSAAYRLLLTRQVWEAEQLAQKLGAQNRRRQALMNSIADRAREHAWGKRDDEVILLYDMNWPSENESPLGVVGLVAARLMARWRQKLTPAAAKA